MTNEQIAAIVENTFDEWMLYPRRRLRKKDFDERSYQRWAVREIADEIRNSPLMPPIMVVEDFIERVSAYSKTNPKTRMIFQIAKSVGYDVLDFIYASDF